MPGLQPTQDQIAAFMSGDMNEPVAMLNLLKFKERADYDADRPEAAEGLSGRQAYLRYGQGVQKVFEKIGAKGWFAAPYVRHMIGEGDWDMVAIAWYPSRQAFLDMPQRPDYQAIHYHRAAGLLHQDLIETTPGVL